MTTPGFGPAGSVGWVYVTAITDTSGMKDDIEKAGGEAGAAGSKAFSKEFREQQHRDANDMFFDKAVQSRMRKVSKQLGRQAAKEIAAGARGTGITLDLDSEVGRELDAIADRFGKLPKDVQAKWKGQFTGLLSGEIDKELRKIEKNMGGFGKSVSRAVFDGFGDEAGRIDLKDLTKRITASIAEGVLQSQDDFDRLFGGEIQEIKVRLNIEDDDIAGNIRRNIPAAIAQFQRLEEVRIQQEERVYNQAVAFNKKYNEQATAEAKKRSAQILALTDQLLAKDQRERDALDVANIRRGLEILKENSRLLDKWADQIDLVDVRYRELFGATDDGFTHLNRSLDLTLLKTRLLGATVGRFKSYAVRELIRPEAVATLKDAQRGLSNFLDRSATGFFPEDRGVGLTLAEARRNVIQNTTADVLKLRAALQGVTPKTRQFFRTVFIESTNLQKIRLKDGIWSLSAWDNAKLSMREFFDQAAREAGVFQNRVGKDEGKRVWSPKWWDQARLGMEQFFGAAYRESRAFGKVRPFADSLTGFPASAKARVKRSVREFYDTWVDKQEIARTKAQIQRAADLITSPFKKVFGKGGVGAIAGRVESFKLPVVVDQDAFRLSIISAAENVEKRLTPAVRDALAKGQKVDWAFSKSAHKEIEKMAKDFEITFEDSARTVEHVLGDSIRRGLRQMNDERNLGFFDTFQRRMNKVSIGLFRAGGSGPFGILTSLIGFPVGIFTTVFNLISDIPKALGKAGKAFQKVAPIITESFGAVGRVIGSVIQGVGKLFSMLAKNPLVLITVSAFALKLGVQAAGTAIGVLVQGIKALAGVATLLGGALYYSAAAAVILGPALVAAGAGAVALFLGASDAFSAMQLLNTAVSSGKTEDWDKYNEAFAKLGTNAKSAVRELRPLFEGLKRARSQLSEKIFAGIGDQIKNILPGLKPVKDAFVGLGDALNSAFKSVLGLFGQSTFIADMTTLLTNAQPIIANFGKAIANVVAGIASLFSTISPLAVSFTDALVRGSESFRSSIENNKPAILDFFKKAYEVASNVWDIIFNLGNLLATFFGTTFDANTGPQGMLTIINNKIKSIIDWITGHPDTIQNWFADSKETMKKAWDAIGGILDVIVSLGTPENQQTLNSLLDFAKGFAGFMEKAKTAWEFIFGHPIEQPKLSPENQARLNPAGRALLNGPPTPTGGEFNPRRNTGLQPRARGGLIDRPEFSWMGEAGPELVVPLRRPMHLIDPAARPAARWLKDKERDKHSTGPQKVVNLTQNITPMQADPRAVAASVVNRAVAVARG